MSSLLRLLIALGTPSGQLKCGWMNTNSTTTQPDLSPWRDPSGSKCALIVEGREVRRASPQGLVILADSGASSRPGATAILTSGPFLLYTVLGLQGVFQLSRDPSKITPVEGAEHSLAWKTIAVCRKITWVTGPSWMKFLPRLLCSSKLRLQPFLGGGLHAHIFSQLS